MFPTGFAPGLGNRLINQGELGDALRAPSSPSFSKSGRALDSPLNPLPPAFIGWRWGRLRHRLRRRPGPFLPKAGVQCIPVDKLENRTLALAASACVLPVLRCNPGPTRTSSAETPEGGRRIGARLPRQGDKCVRLAPSRAKTREPWQASKVCPKGSSWVPLLGASSSSPRFQPALESGTKAVPRAFLEGVCP